MRQGLQRAGTLFLAIAACGFLLYQLHAERGRSAAARAEVTVLRKQIEALGVEPPSVAAPPAASPPSKEEETYRQLLQAVDVDKAHRQFEQFMADLDSSDPAVHRKLVDQYVSSMRYVNPGLAEGLHLTPDREQQLLELLAEAELRAIKASNSQPRAGDVREALAVWLAEQRRQRAELLGEEELARYEEYAKTIPERRQIMELRSQLDSSNSLSDDQATQLIAAVREEREQYIARSMQQPGARESVPEGPVYVLSGYEAGSPLDMQFREAQLKRSGEFVRRLHDRAARILNSVQLRRFDELQAQRLSSERFNMERFRDDPD